MKKYIVLVVIVLQRVYVSSDPSKSKLLMFDNFCETDDNECILMNSNYAQYECQKPVILTLSLEKGNTEKAIRGFEWDD